MPVVNFTSALKRFYPNLTTMAVQASNVAEVLAQLEKQYPGLSDFLTDEHGALRQHINIFVRDAMIADRVALSDAVGERDEILIFQALSGG